VNVPSVIAFPARSVLMSTQMRSHLKGEPSHPFCPVWQSTLGNGRGRPPRADVVFNTCSSLHGVCEVMEHPPEITICRVNGRDFRPVLFVAGQSADMLCVLRNWHRWAAGCSLKSVCPPREESPDRVTAQMKSMTASRLAILGVLIPLSAATCWLYGFTCVEVSACQS
jgi:hypothetical protein